MSTKINYRLTIAAPFFILVLCGSKSLLEIKRKQRKVLSLASRGGGGNSALPNRTRLLAEGERMVITMRKENTLTMVFCGLFAVLTAAASQLSIPIGPVPINLATLSVFLAGGVLGARYGAVSQAVYVLIGLTGLPVFAGWKGGAAVLAGPTGGYLAGYIAAAWLAGLLCAQVKNPFRLAASLTAGLALCYLLGTAWFVFVTKSGIWTALTLCVFPFLIGDAVKIAAAVFLIPRLRRAFQTVAAGGTA